MIPVVYGVFVGLFLSVKDFCFGFLLFLVFVVISHIMGFKKNFFYISFNKNGL